MTLSELCREKSRLSEADISQLERISECLPLIAELTGSDIFIDVKNAQDGSAYVVAQAKPKNTPSLYDGSVVGLAARQEDEPAAYYALENGVSVRDLRAVTQESHTVRQDAIPIRRADGGTIGVLIREKDVSRSLLEEKKYQELARLHEDENGAIFPPQEDQKTVAIQEVHHRVKNSLQMIASILGIQARQTKNPELRRIFDENTARVLSIASTHDIIMSVGVPDQISIRALIERVARNLEMIADVSRPVLFRVDGDDFMIGADAASSIALVVNELVSNSVYHAFRAGKAGTIRIDVHRGTLYSSVTVEDNGMGFDSEVRSGHLGLRLVKLTVHDKLGGELSISSSELGTRVTFDFKMKN